jgi:hypothetical protein
MPGPIFQIRNKEALSLVAEAFVSATDAQVGLLLKAGSIVEVQQQERDY